MRTKQSVQFGLVMLGWWWFISPGPAFSGGQEEKQKNKLPPVQVTVDVSQVPELKEWAAKAKELVEKWHPQIAAMLPSEGFSPPGEVHLFFKKDMKGVAYTAGRKIVIAAEWIKAHPDDYGMVIHELTHVVQSYHKAGRDTGWLVEGIADYVRFFKFEPGKLGRIRADKARFNGSYRVSASFLAFLTEKYDKDIVLKLNRSLREGTYQNELFTKLTAKTLPELEKEWQVWLRNSR